MPRVAHVWQRRSHAALANTIPSTMMTILLTLAGLLCFWLFFRATDFFEKI